MWWMICMQIQSCQHQHCLCYSLTLTLALQGLQHARGLVFSALGQPRSTDAVNRLYAMTSSTSSASHHHPNRQQSHLGPWQGDLRPGDFPWRLAESALDFFASLAGRGYAGAAWSMAAADCLAVLMRRSPQHSAPLKYAAHAYIGMLALHTALGMHQYACAACISG